MLHATPGGPLGRLRVGGRAPLPDNDAWRAAMRPRRPALDPICPDLVESESIALGGSGGPRGSYPDASYELSSHFDSFPR